MTKIKGATSRPAPDFGAIQKRKDAASLYISAQEEGGNWKPLRNSAPIRFMELGGGMCRWPIGDSRQADTFRFCGCACSLEAVYCEAHKKLSIAPNRAKAPPLNKRPLLLATKVS
jgi:hypothetical protein